MPNQYSYNGTDKYNNAATVGEDQLRRFDLSSNAITRFAHALNSQDIKQITAMFSEMTPSQKTGLLSFTFDCNELSGSFMAVSSPIGTPIKIATALNNQILLRLLNQTQNTLVSQMNRSFNRGYIGNNIFHAIPALNVLGNKNIDGDGDELKEEPQEQVRYSI